MYVGCFSLFARFPKKNFALLVFFIPDLKAAPQRQGALGPPGASIMPRGPKGPGLLTQMKTCLPPLKANGNSVK